MLWKRVTRAAGFLGLLFGVGTSITIFLLNKLDPARWVHILALDPRASGLAQDMYQALWACLTCVLVTVLVTLVTTPKPDAELTGLVYSLTDVPKETHASIFHRPAFWGALAMIVFVILQIIFW
jgi:SSS family solute:Na+ symporter